MSTPPTALVAGAGIAGLSAAVQLDELGFRVTLVEKKNIAGGRAYSFTDRVTGAPIDNGQHLLIGAYHETFALLRRVGAAHKVRPLNPTRVVLCDGDSRRHTFLIKPRRAPWGLALAMAGFSGLAFSDKIALVRLYRELNAIARGGTELPRNETAAAWLTRLGQSPRAMAAFWEPLILATLNDSPAITAADGLAAVLSKSYLQAPGDGLIVFPAEPLQAVFADPVIHYLKLRGHEVALGNGVTRFRVLDGRVRTCVLDDGSERKADVFVSAMPPDHLMAALPPAFVAGRPDLESLRDFTFSPIVSVNLYFERSAMDDDFAGFTSGNLHWFFNKGRQPDGTFRVLGVASGAYDLLDKDKRSITEIAVADFKRLYSRAVTPVLKRSLVNIERKATLSCGVGVTAKRPGNKVLDNFYLVGDWTRTGLPPTIESACVSARMMGEYLAAQH